MYLVYDNGNLVEYRSDCENVIIPNGITSIGSDAFEDCISVTSITIPDSVTSIKCKFYDCTNLANIYVDENNKNYCSVDGVLYNKNKSELVKYPQGKKGEYIIPDSVTSIGNCAFEDCANLTSITIPDSVTSIGNWAFCDCENLTSVNIPDGVTSIGKWTFHYTNLISVTIPDGVTSIGDHAFCDCANLKSITIPDSVTSIGALAFRRCTSLASITIPNSVTSIGRSAFEDCTSLADVTMGDGVTSIDSDAFGNTAYYNNDNNCVDGVLYIGDHLVKAKGDIVKGDYKIRQGTKYISALAFNDCSDLTSITVPDSVVSIDGCSAFGDCAELTAITVDENNKNYCSVDDVLYNKDKSRLLCYPEGKTGEYTIPDGVTSIGGCAFSACKKLHGVTIPDSVTNIGDGTFLNSTKLTRVTIGSSVTSIGEKVFFNCAWLSNVNIPNSVTSIGADAFRFCYELSSLTIPDSVTSIGEDAFDECENLVIKTTENSAAHKYALRNDIEFELIAAE